VLKPTHTFYDQQGTLHCMQRKRWTFFHFHNFARCWTAARCWKLGDLNFAIHSRNLLNRTIISTTALLGYYAASSGNKIIPVGWVTTQKSAVLIYFADEVWNYTRSPSPASELYMPTFRNTLSVPSSLAGRYEEWLGVEEVEILLFYVVLCVYCCHLMCIFCTMCIFLFLL